MPRAYSRKLVGLGLAFVALICTSIAWAAEPPCPIDGNAGMWTGQTRIDPATSKMLWGYRCAMGHVFWVVPNESQQQPQQPPASQVPWNAGIVNPAAGLQAGHLIEQERLANQHLRLERDRLRLEQDRLKQSAQAEQTQLANASNTRLVDALCHDLAQSTPEQLMPLQLWREVLNQLVEAHRKQRTKVSDEDAIKEVLSGCGAGK